MIPFFIHRLAEVEFLKQAAWYERKKLGLGCRFRLRFERCIREIVANPERFAIEHVEGMRLGWLKPFPFAVVYRIEPHRLRIVAVADQRRRPRYWIKRLKNR